MGSLADPVDFNILPEPRHERGIGFEADHRAAVCHAPQHTGEIAEVRSDIDTVAGFLDNLRNEACGIRLINLIHNKARHKGQLHAINDIDHVWIEALGEMEAAEHAVVTQINCSRASGPTRGMM